MIKVSVIIPVYNTQNYLEECVDSVLNQTLTDIEVICVNDGSTDSSRDILENYARKDNRVKVINQENIGLGASRNVGMKFARGEYVSFLDSDDYLQLDALEILYNKAKHEDLDMIIFKLLNFNYKTLKQSRSPYFDMQFLSDIVGNEVFNWETVKNRVFDISVTATSKLFKRELISDIMFPEGLIFEDNLFFTKAFFKAKRVYFYQEYFYYRRLRPDSITKSYHDKFSDCIVIFDEIIKFLKINGLYDEFNEQIFNCQCDSIFHRFKLVKKKYKEDFFEKIKDNFLKYQRELESNGTLKICAERSLVIFYNAIYANTYREFELSVNEFDLISDRDKLQLNNNLMKRSYTHKIDRLTKLNQEYLQEIKDLRKSNSIFSKINEFFK
ncbi:glycosyltransferase family 2 protein [Methanobrevibacter sp.]